MFINNFDPAAFQVFLLRLDGTLYHIFLGLFSVGFIATNFLLKTLRLKIYLATTLVI